MARIPAGHRHAVGSRSCPPDDSRREALYLSAVLNAPTAAGIERPFDSPHELARLLSTDPAKARLTLSQMPISAEAQSRLMARLGLTEK